MRALVLAGGGMRGAFGSGVTAALSDMGERFDAIYGTSAGGAMAAWFSVGQADDGVRTWRYAGDPGVLNYRRWLTRQGPLIDLDHLFDHIYPNEVGLDVPRFLKLNFPVYVTASDVRSGACHYLDLRKRPVLTALKATSALPFVTRGAIHLDGHELLDGGFTDPVPVRRALEDGADELVVVLNRLATRRAPEPKSATWIFQRKYPALAREAAIHHRLCTDAYRLAANPPEGVRSLIIRPSKDLGVGRFTRDLPLLEAWIEHGRQRARALVS